MSKLRVAPAYRQVFREVLQLPAVRPWPYILLGRGGLKQVARASRYRIKCGMAHVYAHEEQPVAFVASSPLAIPVRGWCFVGRYSGSLSSQQLAGDMAVAMSRTPQADFWRKARGPIDLDLKDAELLLGVSASAYAGEMPRA